MAKPVEIDTATKLVQSILDYRNRRYPKGKLDSEAEKILLENAASMVILMEGLYSGRWNSVTLIEVREDPRFKEPYEETLASVES